MYKDENHYTLYQRGKIWGYYWYDSDNKRHFRSTGRKTKHEAMKVISQRIKDGGISFDPVKERITFKEYSSVFYVPGKCPILKEKDRTGHSLSEPTIKVYRDKIEKRFLPYFGEMYLDSISPDKIKDFENSLLAEGLTRKTINVMVAPLRHIMQQAKAEGRIDRNPFDEVGFMKEDKSPRDKFTTEQVKAMLTAPWPSQLSMDIFTMAVFTGLRIGEIQALKVGMIKPDIIEVCESHTEVVHKDKDTKNHKTRYIPYPVPIDGMIRRLCHGKCESDYVFSKDGKEPFKRRTVTRHLYKVMDGLGIDGTFLTFHSSRHFFDSYMYYDGGVDKETIKSVIGHNSDTMFRHYLHVDNNVLDSVRTAQAMMGFETVDNKVDDTTETDNNANT